MQGPKPNLAENGGIKHTFKPFFLKKKTTFYLNFLKDKYKVPYICDKPKGENHYRIDEEPQTTLPKNTHLTPKARRPNSNRPKTRQHKRKRKSNRGRRKGKSDEVMVMEHVVSERKRIRK